MAAHIKHFIFNGDLSIKEMTDVSVVDGTESKCFPWFILSSTLKPYTIYLGLALWDILFHSVTFEAMFLTSQSSISFLTTSFFSLFWSPCFLSSLNL